jgi:hypothetical protein
MTAGFAESEAEEAGLGWLESLGCAIRHGPEIAFRVDGGERSDPDIAIRIRSSKTGLIGR